MTGSDSWASFEGQNVQHVDLELVPANLTRMDLFDRVRTLSFHAMHTCIF